MGVTGGFVSGLKVRYLGVSPESRLTTIWDIRLDDWVSGWRQAAKNQLVIPSVARR